MIEIERKFQLSPEKLLSIKQALEKKFGQLKSVHQVDKVFLLGIDSFKDFKKGMPVVRLRTEGELTKLTYKKAINESGDSIEYELGIDSAPTMEAILLATDFRVVTIVVKDRIEVVDGSLTYALDTVDKLGSFIEIEVVAKNTKNLAETEKLIMSAATTFGLSALDIQKMKYDQLIAQSN